jgi:type III secretion protein C
MATHVHVPDDHFLVISGMVRNARSYQKAGIPCLGGLPVVGAAFSKTKRIKEKRNVVIFVRPHIVNSFQDYTELTEAQEGYLEVAESAISSEAY